MDFPEFSPPKNLLIARHAQSQFNLDDLHQGWYEGVPLSAAGTAQAERMRDILTSVPIDYAIVSRLLRTNLTAQIALPEDVNILVDERIHDYRISESLEGQSSDYLKNDPDFNKWLATHEDDPDFSLTDGESINDFNRRVEGFIVDLFSGKHSDKSVLIVTHERVVRHIVHKVSGQEMPRGSVPNATPYVLHKDSDGLVFRPLEG